MNFYKYSCFFACILTISSTCTLAQSTWINAIPTLYHPSFAGSSGRLRVSSNNIFQDNRTKFENTLSRYYANANMISADNFFGKIHTGVSLIMYESNNWGNPSYTTTNVGGGILGVAPKFSYREKITFSPSIQVSYSEARAKFFEPTYNPNDSSFTSSYVLIPYHYLSASTGAMLNSRKFL